MGPKPSPWGTGATFTLAILGVMYFFPQEYNDHLLRWYTRRRLAPKSGSPP